MQCSTCQHLNAPDATHCAACAAPLATAPPPSPPPVPPPGSFGEATPPSSAPPAVGAPAPPAGFGAAAQPAAAGGLPGWIKPVGVVAGLAALAFAAFTLLGGGGRSGAASPDEAARDFVTATAAEDPLAILASLAPGEVRDLAGLVDLVIQRGDEVGLTQNGAATPGIDFSAENVEFEVDEFDGGVAKVTLIRGDFELDIDEGGVAPAVADQLDGDVSERFDENDLVTTSDDGDEIEPFLMAVEQDGGWFVSPAYTLFEYLVVTGGLRDADFENDADPDAGGASAEELGEAIIEALADADAADIASVFAQDELGVFVDYADTLQSLIDDEVFGSDGDTTIDIERVELSEVAFDGDGVKLSIERFAGTLEFDDGFDVQTIEFDFDGECIETDDDGFRDIACIPSEFEDLTGIGEPFVIAVREDDKLRLSPVSTALEYARIVLDNASDEVILRGLGLESLATPETIDIGSSNDLTSNDAGFLIVEVEADADSLIVIDVTEDAGGFVDVNTFDPDGRRFFRDYLEVEESGTHRIEIESDRFEEFDLTVSVAEIEVQPVSEGEFSGAVGGGVIPGFEIDFEDASLAVVIAESDIVVIDRGGTVLRRCRASDECEIERKERDDFTAIIVPDGFDPASSQAIEGSFSLTGGATLTTADAIELLGRADPVPTAEVAGREDFVNVCALAPGDHPFEFTDGVQLFDPSIRVFVAVWEYADETAAAAEFFFQLDSVEADCVERTFADGDTLAVDGIDEFPTLQVDFSVTDDGLTFATSESLWVSDNLVVFASAPAGEVDALEELLFEFFPVTL